jgi:hypothetical protein
MYCSKKCEKKDISSNEPEERKCKVKGCKNKFRSRFNNICYTCQMTKKYCITCGSELNEGK